MKHGKKYKLIATMEDGVLRGGFGSSVVDFLNDLKSDSDVLRFGWPDKFISHGSSVTQLRKEHSLDLQSIYKKLCAALPGKLIAQNHLVS